MKQIKSFGFEHLDELDGAVNRYLEDLSKDDVTEIDVKFEYNDNWKVHYAHVIYEKPAKL